MINAENRQKVKQILETMQSNKKDAALSDVTKLSKVVMDNQDEMRSKSQATEKSFQKMMSLLSDKMDELKASLSNKMNSSQDPEYALTLQNMAKMLAEGLGNVKKSIDDKPVPVWRWPQYLYSGLRDRSFSPINPATDGIGIGSFDYVSVAYPDAVTEVYTFKTTGSSGATVAIITIVYTDSTKASLASVTKTPLTK